MIAPRFYTPMYVTIASRPLTKVARTEQLVKQRRKKSSFSARWTKGVVSEGNRYGAGRRSKAFQLGVERVDGGELVGVVELAGEPGIDCRLREEKEPLPLLHALFPAHALRVTGSKLTAGSLLLLPFLVAVSIVRCALAAHLAANRKKRRCDFRSKPRRNSATLFRHLSLFTLTGRSARYENRPVSPS